ncbi:MAG TPA: 3-isopropylmalate dehydratase large subunit [Caulobacteraceae bacterium]|jgi:3-isopropylmalate/(R)-2-methylmalate dehydratase large subunit|nr:3-isopropylmalate dehydratase large subunit [Caulobacteraceae bacterium]
MPQTLVQKIIARAAGRPTVEPGEIVTCKVDLAMFHDSSGPRRVAPRLKALGAQVWDPSKVVVVSDHYVPAVDLESAAILKLTREWARDEKVGAFYDMRGICHTMLAEGGHLAPGMFCVGGDSHSTTGGAFGCYMAGFGATEMTGVMVTGEIWTRTPQTIRVHGEGRFPAGVSAKDLMLHLCRTLGMENNFKAVEYVGPAVEALSMPERMVLANMAAELGAETGMIPADAVTIAAMRAAGRTVDEAEALSWRSDADARFERTVTFDASILSPQVARPHTPANSGPVAEADERRIDQAYIGACVGAKLEDLHMAAAVLKGRKVAAGTRLLIAPASTRTTAQAAADGTLAILTEAGAILLPTGCGACAGYGAGVLAAGEVCISTTNRNFKGRMGHKEAEVYLGSPFTVAASAVAGRIVDPRPFLK